MNKDDDYLNSVNITLVVRGQPKAVDSMPIPGVVILVIVGAAFLGGIIVYISKMQERRAQRKKQQAKGERGKILSKCLQSKPWNMISINSITGGDARFRSADSFNSDDDTDEERSVGIVSDAVVVDHCKICEQQYTEACIVYESNNPRCGHVFHKGCMDRWLNTGYQCPICQEVYALQDASKRQHTPTNTWQPAVSETLSEDTSIRSQKTATPMEMTVKLPDAADPFIFDM